MDQTQTENKALVEKHEKEVRDEALRLKRRGRIRLPLEDMVAAGFEGLLLAQRSYKPQLGFKFWTYARYIVRRAIFDEVRRQRGITQRQYDSIRAEYALRDVSPDLQPTAVPTSDAERDLEVGSAFDELCARVTGAAGGFAISDVEVDGHADMRAAIAGLSARHREVVEFYYLRELSLVEIANELGRDKSVISRNHAEALAQLRDRLAHGD